MIGRGMKKCRNKIELDSHCVPVRHMPTHNTWKGTLRSPLSVFPEMKGPSGMFACLLIDLLWCCTMCSCLGVDQVFSE